jgi:2'-5' RNA ligase
VTNGGRDAATVEGDERIRLFCGLQLDDDAVALLVEWQTASLSRGRIVPPANLHVTLAFLGHRSAAEVPAIAHALGEASARVGRVELRPRRYRETRSVGMLVLEDVGGQATALAEDLQERLERLGVYRRERRRWLAHVTVLRFREPAGLAPTPPNTCSIHAVRSALYRSALRAGGAQYEVMATGALGGR